MSGGEGALTSISPTYQAQLICALNKPAVHRSYDDVLLLKSYVSKTEFITKSIVGVVGPRQMNDLCRGLELRVFQNGDAVFHQGDVGDQVYIILSGKVDVIVRYNIDLTQGDNAIREKVVASFSTGNFFGERALQFSEPRSASVICREPTYLISVEKSLYLRILNEAKQTSQHPVMMRQEQFGTKEGIMHILSKIREKRTNSELDAVASVLIQRVPYFKQFTMSELIEICRFAETATIWGRSTLCKQGEIGQAFYAILSGTVQVWVNDELAASLNSPNKAGAANNRTPAAAATSAASMNNGSITSRQQQSQSQQHQAAAAAGDMLDNLGILRNQLVSGDIFGERALESDTALRQATIVTGEDCTELLVFSKEDYLNFTLLKKDDSMVKLQLLRRTDLFHSLDVVHLRALARFMTPVTFKIDEELYKAGKPAERLIIIEKGECRVTTEVLEGSPLMSAEEMEKAHHHRYMEDTHHHTTNTAAAAVANSSGGGGATTIIPGLSQQQAQGQEQAVNPSPHLHALAIAQQQQPSQSLKKITTAATNQQHQLLMMQSTSQKKLGVLETAKKNIRKSLHDKDPVMLMAMQQAAIKKEEGKEDKEDKPAPSIRELRRNNPRFQSAQLMPLGKRKKVDLGRIAPNSVLAAYVLAVDTVHVEVFHPETVTAKSLVHAYTVDKKAYFTHMPKDSMDALLKLIQEYKAPVLSPLWENAPRILDENKWKMERTWGKFRSLYAATSNNHHGGHKDVNILDTFRRYENVHISLNSGNDPALKLMPHGDEYYRDYSTQHKVAVTMNWGLPSPTSAAVAAAAAALEKEGQGNKDRRQQGSDKKRVDRESGGRFSPSAAAHRQWQGQGQGQDSSTSPPDTGASSSSSMALGLPAPSVVSALVSTNIRQRLNESHSVNALLDQSSSTMTIVKNASSPSLRLHHMTGQRPSPMKGQGQWKPSSNSSTSRGSALSLLQPTNKDDTPNYNEDNDNLQQPQPTKARISALKREHVIELPFTLIQIHREYHPSNPMKMVETGRRLLRSYVRVCGSFSACAKAKELADMQMEQLYLGPLYRSHAEREQELLLTWQTFKGYESMSLDDSDHFFIYCRSTPLEVASFHPKKSIFNVRFPAICKPQEQRYAVIMVNTLPRPNTHAHATGLNAVNEETEDDQDNDSEEDEDNDGDSDTGFEATMLTTSHSHSHSHSSRRLAKLSNHTGKHQRPRSSHNNHSKSPIQQKTAANLIVAAAVAVNSAVNIMQQHKQSSKASLLASSNAPAMMLPTTDDNNNGGSMMLSAASFISNNNHFPLPGHAPAVGMLQRPRYLSELSVIYETVVISSTRLEALRYAIQRFGSLQSPQTEATAVDASAVNAHAMEQQQRRRLSITNILSSSLDDVTDALRSSSPPAAASSPSSPATSRRRLPGSKISLRPLDSSSDGSHDRLLAALHHDNSNSTHNRQVIIMPLFKWILIDNETLSTLDFTHAFHEPSIRKVFLAEEFESSYSHAIDGVNDEQRELERIVSEAEAEVNDHILLEEEEIEEIEDEHHNHTVVRSHAYNDYRDFAHDVIQRKIPPQLIESFAEVGLVPKSTKNVVLHVSSSTANEEEGEEEEQHLEYQQPSLQFSRPLMEQAMALQILEREVISREVGEEIQLLKDNNNHPAHANTHANSNEGSGGLDMSLSLMMTAEPQNKGSSSHSNNTNKQVPPEDRVKASLKTVSRSLQRNAKILQTHDQLCELENHIAKKGNLRGLPGSTIAGLGLMGAASSDPKSAVIQKRMGVIEALQKVHVQLPVSNASHSNNSNSGNETVTLASLYVTTPLLTDGNSNNHNIHSGGQQQQQQQLGLGSNSKGKQVNKSSVLAAQQKLSNPSHYGPPGSSAKRITETLRLLSESLDAQLLSSSSSVGLGRAASAGTSIGHSNSMTSLGSHNNAHSNKK